MVLFGLGVLTMADDVVDNSLNSLPNVGTGALGTGGSSNYNYPVQTGLGGNGFTNVGAGGSSSAGVGVLGANEPSTPTKNMWGWGTNSDGQLGDNRSTIDKGCPRQTTKM
jgi:hypothetical protein